MIHKEGKISLGLLTLVTIAAIVIDRFWYPIMNPWSIAALVFLWIALVQFFRNPGRKIPTANNKFIYAPADGKVVVIEEVMEPEYLKKQVYQVSIFMSPINVHVNRVPVDGKVTYLKYHPGKYLVAWHPKSSTENERTSIGIFNGQHTILLRQIAGAMARRIKWYIKEGDEVKQGQELGFIKFGSRVDIFLPITSEIKVQINDHVKGNLDVIAELKG